MVEGDAAEALAHLRYARDHMAHERPRYAWICHELALTLLAAGGDGEAEEARTLWLESLAIARERGISEKTVINHVTHIFEKTGAGNRVEAAAFAAKNGLSK